jgi:Uma2 family endonuclease
VSTITKPVTVDEYDQMIEDGTIGENDHVELWDGTVVPKMPKNPRHRVGTRKTAEALERVIPPVWHVAKEEAVVIKPRSKPEPDVAVIRAELKYDSSRDATAADCCLVVEVADRSLADDQGKKLGYAAWFNSG